MVAESRGGDTWHAVRVDCARLFALKSAGLTLRRRFPVDELDERQSVVAIINEERGGRNESDFMKDVSYCPEMIASRGCSHPTIYAPD